MFKNDTMAQYVADRHPRFAPRVPRPAMERIDWTAAAVMQEVRREAVATLARPAATVTHLDSRRTVNLPAPATA